MAFCYGSLGSLNMSFVDCSKWQLVTWAMQYGVRTRHEAFLSRLREVRRAGLPQPAGEDGAVWSHECRCVHSDSSHCRSFCKFLMVPGLLLLPSEGSLHMHRILGPPALAGTPVSWRAPSVFVPALPLVPRTPSSQLQVVLAAVR